MHGDETHRNTPITTTQAQHGEYLSCFLSTPTLSRIQNLVFRPVGQNTRYTITNSLLRKGVGHYGSLDQEGIFLPNIESTVLRLATSASWNLKDLTTSSIFVSLVNIEAMSMAGSYTSVNLKSRNLTFSITTPS